MKTMAELVIQRFNKKYTLDGDRDCILVGQLRDDGLSDDDIARVLTRIDDVCKVCFNSDESCQCWLD